MDKSQSSNSIDTNQLPTPTSSTDKQHHSTNDHIQFNSSTLDSLDTTEEQYFLDTPSPKPFQRLMHLQNIPTPPKLIKIPITASENTDSSTSVTSPTSSHGQVQSIDQVKINPAEEMSGQHIRTVNHNTTGSKSTPPAVSLTWLCNGSLNSANPDSNGRDPQYLRSIANLQERISQQLSSTNRFSVMETADNYAMMSHTPGLLFDREKLLVTPFRPPQYCIASPTERLLDIISESPLVKQHEHKIQHIDTYSQQHSKQYFIQQQASLNTLTGSKHKPTATTFPKYRTAGAVIQSQEDEQLSPLKLVNNRSIPTTSPSLPKLITMGDEAFTIAPSTNHQAKRSLPMEEAKRSVSPISSDSQVVMRNSHQLENSHIPSYIPLSSFQSTPAAKRLHPQTFVASHETTSTQSSAISSLSLCVSSTAQASPVTGSPVQLTANPAGLLNMNNGSPVQLTANQPGLLNMSNVMYPSTPTMVYNPNNLQTVNPSNCCLAVNPIGGLSPVSMLLVTPVTPLVQQIPLALNNPVALASASAAGSNQMMCYIAPNGLITPIASGATPSSIENTILSKSAREQVLNLQNPSAETDQPESRQTNGAKKDAKSQPVNHNSSSSALPVAYDNHHVCTSVVVPPSARNELSLPPAKRLRLDTSGHSGTGERLQATPNNSSIKHVVKIKKKDNSITAIGIDHTALSRSVGCQISAKEKKQSQVDSEAEEVVKTPTDPSSFTTLTSES